MRAEAVKLLATWFYSGKLRPAPGTWGSAAAFPFALPIAWYGGPWVLLGASLLLFAVGIWASQEHALRLGRADPGEIVVDEVAAQWLTLVPLCIDWRIWLLAFFVFRAFDVVKPWPCSWCDRNLKGGFGIMVDDLFAGLYASILCGLLGWWLWDLTCFPWN